MGSRTCRVSAGLAVIQSSDQQTQMAEVDPGARERFEKLYAADTFLAAWRRLDAVPEGLKLERSAPTATSTPPGPTASTMDTNASTDPATPTVPCHAPHDRFNRYRGGRLPQRS